ncbi:MAG: tyrosine-type recombinase/integrase [Bacteroidales bacterium]
MGSNPTFHPTYFQVAQYQQLENLNFLPAPNFGAICDKLDLKKLLHSEDMYPFKKAKLNDCGGDLSGRWYIEFYAWDVQMSKLVRKRYYEVNNIISEQDRRIYANRIIQQLNKLLKEGYHFDVNKVPSQAESEETQTYTLNDAISFALEIKKLSIRTSSFPSYKSTVNLFQKWASNNRLQEMNVVYFDKLRAVYFDDYLLVGCAYAAKTVNGHISYMKSLFQVLVEHEIIRNNPFKNLKKHKEGESRKNMAFNEEQMERMKKTIEEKDPSLWLFIQFIYYCYLRPNEVRQLKHSYLHMDKNQIFIPGYISKNGKDGYVTIPESFLNVLIESKEFSSRQEFIFQSRDKLKPISKNVMGSRFRMLTRDLNLDKDYTFYLWKHSGVVEAYKAGIDIKTIQSQCRHQSLEQTDIYLKSLGLNVSLAINKMPEL